MTLLLGPPGAGKSLLLKVLSGRLKQTKHLRVRAHLPVSLASPRVHLSCAGGSTSRVVHVPQLVTALTPLSDTFGWKAQTKFASRS